VESAANDLANKEKRQVMSLYTKINTKKSKQEIGQDHNSYSDGKRARGDYCFSHLSRMNRFGEAALFPVKPPTLPLGESD